MNLSLKSTKKPDAKSRQLLRGGKWKAAVTFYEEQARATESDATKWNLLGDIQYRAGDLAGAATSWLRVMDIYSQESLHENVLGIGRKIVQRCPEEASVHLAISEAYLGLEYYADAIAAFRSFTKLCKQATTVEKKNWFRRVLNLSISHLHLLEEIQQLYDDCQFEDIELAREIEAYVSRMAVVQESPQDVADTSELLVEDTFEPAYVPAASDGLITIDGGWTGQGADFLKQDSPGFISQAPAYGSAAKEAEYAERAEPEEEDIPDGQGKDHFDLGIVYAEMKLWDAAITEFQTARRDRSIRTKATIELAQCLKNSNDPHRALRLLEDETAMMSEESEVQDDLNFHMGALNEMLGNAETAAACFNRVGADSQFHDEASRRAAQYKA